MTRERTNRVATAIMQTRVRFGWTFQRVRHRVMAIDLAMAAAAIDAMEGEARK